MPLKSFVTIDVGAGFAIQSIGANLEEWGLQCPP